MPTLYKASTNTTEEITFSKGGPGSGRHKEISDKISSLKPGESVKFGNIHVTHNGNKGGTFGNKSLTYGIGFDEGTHNAAKMPNSAANKVIEYMKFPGYKQ